jgi:amino acid adenylation domain-containing protein
MQAANQSPVVFTDSFAASAAAHQNATAIRHSQGEISYAALQNASKNVAGFLQAHLDFQQGDVVGLALPMGPAYVVAALGVAQAGGIFMALDPGLPPRRLPQLLAKAQSKLIFTEKESLPHWTQAAAPISVIELETVLSQNFQPQPVAFDENAASYIVFTSGSTGEPKAILGTHKGLKHFLEWEIQEFRLDPSSRVSQLAPPTFDVSLRDILTPLLAGGTLCIPPSDTRLDSRSLLRWLDSEAITLVHCVPSLFRELIRELETHPQPTSLLTKLQFILLAGEPLYGVDVQRWQTLMGDRTQLVNLYGPSETTLAKAFHRIPNTPLEASRMIPVGRPIPGAALLLLKDGVLCDRGQIGEVFIKTPFMSRGYLGDPTLTSEKFVQNPLTPNTPDTVYQSGDLGRYLPDWSVELLGRQDGQVKVNGNRIELAEIEQALLRHPSVTQAVATAHNSPNHQVSLTAYIIASETLADLDLRTHLGEWLPPAVHPSFFVQLESFPLNLHGKVMRKSLPKPSELLYLHNPKVEPDGLVEAQLAELWSSVLDLRSISVTHTFAELGGDSLKAVRLLSKIFHQFGTQVKLQEIFPRSTVRELAALVQSRRPAVAPSETKAPIAPMTAEELELLSE